MLRRLRHDLRAQTESMTPSIAWRREAWTEEMLDDFP